MANRRLQTYGLAATFAIGALWLLSHSFSVDRDYTELGGPVPAHVDLSSPPGAHNVADSHIDATTTTSPHALLRRNVTFATSFVYHGDVYMTLAKSMGDLMDTEEAPTQISVFAQPFPFGFQDIVQDYGLWKHQGVRAEHEKFVDFLNSETGDGAVDLVVLGTCQYDLPYFHEDLKAAWEKRDADHKFKIVCYVHHVVDMDWKRWLPWWSRRDSIRLVAISEHVAKAFREGFAEAADSRDIDLFSADFEHVPVDVHVPIIEVPNLPKKSSARHLSKAVIQGKFEFERRDYARIFQELIDSLREDPEAWGYLPLDGYKSFQPDERSPVPPFQLLLVGSQYLGVPDELENVVTIYRDLPYKGFYDIISDCDIVLPAFADNSYYKIRASSTIALATELNVPMLVTERTRRTYGFIDDDRIVVTRPALMSEVQALYALRTGDATRFLARSVGDTGMRARDMPAVRAGVERMMQAGWRKPTDGWDSWRAMMWDRNRAVAAKMLRDEP